MEEVNRKLVKYIEEEVFPKYYRNEIGHGVGHIITVIKRSFEIVKENNLNVDHNMVYTIAAYHDIGHYIDRETHEIISAEIMTKDKFILDFFSPDKIKIIKEAIEDHRASLKGDPRSVYGKIVSSADRNISIADSFFRTYTYRKKHHIKKTDDEIFEDSYKYLKEKFGEKGYAKFYFKDSKYEKFLKDIRELLSDKEKFIEKQKGFISKMNVKIQ